MSELTDLIHFWESHLFHNRTFMAIGLVVLVEQTIKLLKELASLRGEYK